MSELRVLSEARGRRPPSRHAGSLLVHATVLALLGLVIGVAALLVLMTSPAKGPTARALALHVRTRPAATARVRPPVRPGWTLTPAPASERVNVVLKLGLRSGLLFDVRTGRVLWERDPAQELPIASLTKMMTALVVVAHSRPTQRFLITIHAVHFTGSGVGLLPLGKRVARAPLLYGLLLPSGNDAAIALAQGVAGDQQRFIGMMNGRAHAMGLGCTHFNTVSGIVNRANVNQGNYSCAFDLARLARAVLEQPTLAPIVASRSAILPFPIKGGKLFLYNNNPLLVDRFPGTDGVKTGFTDAAGVCLIAAARRGRTWLAVVLLHSGDILDQAEQLLNAGFAKLARAHAD